MNNETVRRLERLLEDIEAEELTIAPHYYSGLKSKIRKAIERVKMKKTNFKK